MKHIAYIFQFLGCIVLLVLTCRMAGAFSSFITKDVQLAYLLFGGIFIAFIGFHMDARLIKPANEFQRIRKRQQIKGSRNVLVLTSLAIVFLILLV
jgi:hypothetical protein